MSLPKRQKTVSGRRNQLSGICNIGQSGSSSKNNYTDAVWKLNQSAIELEYLTLNP
jgi:cobalt-zinc-cadmium resistance protein CzcA